MKRRTIRLERRQISQVFTMWREFTFVFVKRCRSWGRRRNAVFRWNLGGVGAPAPAAARVKEGWGDNGDRLDENFENEEYECILVLWRGNNVQS